MTEPTTPARSSEDSPAGGRLPVNVTEHQLRVALTWVQRGVPVVPCSRKDKGAMVAGFGRDATAEQLAPFSDPDQVRAWYLGRFKRAHVGLLTRRFVVVDLDVLKADAQAPTGRWEGCRSGKDVLQLLADQAGQPLPVTYTVASPSTGKPFRGEHLYFRQPDEPIGCATGDGQTAPHLGPLVDVRGMGGYIIAAGSYSTVQGCAYERISPVGLVPQPLPKWLYALLRPAERLPVPRAPRTPAVVQGSRAERYAEAALTGAINDVAAAVEGERNRTLFAKARRLGELAGTAQNVLTEADVTLHLVAAAHSAGLSEGDALRTVRSGWSRGLSAPVATMNLQGSTV